MRPLFAVIILALAWCDAGAATYQFTDPSAALTAIPTMTESDTMKLVATFLVRLQRCMDCMIAYRECRGE